MLVFVLRFKDSLASSMSNFMSAFSSSSDIEAPQSPPQPLEVPGVEPEGDSPAPRGQRDNPSRPEPNDEPAPTDEDRP